MIPLLHAAGTQSTLHWHLHADVIFICVFLLAAYFYALTRLRGEHSDAGRVRKSQAALFIAGVAVIYVASSSPLHEMSEDYLASAHMTQHLLYTLVAPPLLIAGTPGWLLRIPLRDPATLRFARFMTLPVLTFGVFNATQLFLHLPTTVDFALTHHWGHFGIHAVLIGTALMMWWPVLSPIPELPRLSYPLQMGYLFVQSLLPSVLAAFVTFADGVVYDYYATAPRLWGLTPVEDQQYAGFVMKIVGSLILWGFIAYAFFRWYDTENSRDQDPRWEEVKEEMLRLGLPVDEPVARPR